MSLVITIKHIINNPINAKRWSQFKNNKRGYWSFWVFWVLFLASMLGELWINDQPIMVSYQQQWYFPLVEDIPENKLRAGLRNRKG